MPSVFSNRGKMLKRALFTSLLALVLLASSALAGTKVEIDRSFGSRGIVRADLGPSYSAPAFTSVAPQADGSLLVTRMAGSGEERIRRYTAAGALDPGFAPLMPPAVPTAVDAEGKTVRLILATPFGSLERLNSDGTPDLTFGVHSSEEESRSEPAGFDIEKIERLPSGKILVGGTLETAGPVDGPRGKRQYVEQVALARFEHDGHLDLGFGNGGAVKLETDAGIAGVRLGALTPRPDEGVAVALLDSEASQFSEAEAHSGSTIAVLTADGRPDAAYGSGGAIPVPDAAIFSIHAPPGGELLAAGDRWGPAFVGNWLHESDLVVARYSPGGTPDPAFGGDGSVVLDLAGLDLFGSVLWAEDGSIWLGGAATAVEKSNCRRYGNFCTETPFVAHVSAAGALDRGFGSGGILRLDGLAYPYGNKWTGRGVLTLAARPGGGVFAGGGSGTVAFVDALTPGGEPDRSFGDGGLLTVTEPHRSEASIQSLALDSRDRILVSGEDTAGIVATSGTPALVRYLPSGALDRSFGGGFVRVPGKETGVVVGEGDSYFVLSGRSEGAVTKVLASGRIDRSFGDEGTADIGLGPEFVSRGKHHRFSLLSRQMVALPGGRLLIAGEAGRSFGRPFVLRLRADGTPDPAFDGDGFTQFGFGGRPGAVNQIAVQRDGRILVAGYVERPGGKGEGETLSVVRLRRDGSRDPTFGHRGLALLPIARHSFAYALAVEGDGRILVAGKSFDRASRARELLLRLDAHGHLDRSFGRRGIVGVSVPFRRGGLWWAPRRLLLLRHRILVLRDSVERQLVVYSRDGRRRRAFTVGRGAEPHRHWVLQAPRGVLQRGKLLLGWTIYRQERKSFKLRRLDLRGVPSS
jgi:uncharacterized delta-60 repeat protein